MIKEISVQFYDRNHIINPPTVQKDNFKSDAVKLTRQ